MSAEHATVKAGEEVLVETVATAVNAKGNEVDRYRIGAPSLGWISADNYTLVSGYESRFLNSSLPGLRKASSTDSNLESP